MKRTNLAKKLKDKTSLSHKFYKLFSSTAAGLLVVFISLGFSHTTDAQEIVKILGVNNIEETSVDVRIEYNEGIVSKGEHLSTTFGKVLSVNDCREPMVQNYTPGGVTLSIQSNLTRGTAYYFKACVIDTAGKLHISNEIAFQTLARLDDPEPPDPEGTIGNPVPNSPGGSIKLENPLGKSGIDNIPDLIKAILEIALKIGVPLIALAIIYAGFKFIAAQGNPEKLKEAKQTLIYVVIGAAILLAAYAIATAIVNTVQSVTG